MIRVLALSPSGSGFAAGTTQGTIHVCETGCRNFEADGSLNDLRFSEEGELVIADGNIRLVKPGTALPSLVRGDRANYGSARFEAGRRRILTINGKGAILAVDLDTGYASSVFCCSSIWGDVEFLDHGRRAIWAGHWPGIWDFAENKLAGRFIAQREFMTFGPIALDSVGGLVYMGSQDGRVYRWDAESRQLLSKSMPLAGYVMTVSVLGASGWIAYASQPGIVHLWNPKAGLHRIVDAARPTSNVVFDQQRGLAAFGTESGGIEFWDLQEGRLVDRKPVFQ